MRVKCDRLAKVKDEGEVEVVFVKNEVIEVHMPQSLLLRTDGNSTKLKTTHMMVEESEVGVSEDEVMEVPKSFPFVAPNTDTQLPQRRSQRRQQQEHKLLEHGHQYNLPKSPEKVQVKSENSKSRHSKMKIKKEKENSSFSKCKCVKESRVTVKTEPGPSVPKDVEVSLIQNLLNSIKEPVDDDQTFAEYMLSELRTLANPVLKLQVKRNIMQTIWKARDYECSDDED